MLIISFATANTPYMGVISQFLIPSLKQLNLNYDIAYPPDAGHWLANTQLKPVIIKEMLLKHKQPLVYIDADATVEYYPTVFDTLQDYDIGVHYFDWYKFWKNQENNPKREILGGTIYFNYNEKVLEFMDEWIKLTTGYLNDMLSLNVVLPRWEQKLKIFNLPIEYIAICKTNQPPDWIKNPCIIHHQASRQFRGYRKKP
jgi:hypothetical protein